MDSRQPLLIITGPTGSGKSALALALAEAFDGTVINADSMQVYGDLAVLTARPDAEDMARAPHRLYGVVDAAEACSAGRWRAMALAEIAAAQEVGRLPILAGGTGLYLSALLQGLADVPESSPALREEARALHARLGAAAFHARLAELDPDGAAKLRSGDTQRLLRAYEVVIGTGRPLADWQRDQAPPIPLNAAAIVLLPPREALYAACDARFLKMLGEGAAEETVALMARGLSPHLPAMKAVGLREIAARRAGSLTREAAIAAAQQATRRYVKRQLTWLRHRLPEEEILPRMTLSEQYSERFLPEIFAFIRQTLLTRRP